MTTTRHAAPQATLLSWRDRLNLGAYTSVEAAWLAETTRQAVAQWRRAAYDAVSQRPTLLSYLQLVDLAVVISFRQAGATIPDIQRAHKALRRYFDDEHPFARMDLKTRGKGLLTELALQAKTLRAVIVERDDGAIWADRLCTRFEQFDYDDGLALRWYVRGRDRALVVDPRVAFGAPTIIGTGVPTRVIGERFAAGEAVLDIVEDFGVTPVQVEDALEFERTHILHAA